MADTYHDPGSFPGVAPEETCTAEHPDPRLLCHPAAVTLGKRYQWGGKYYQDWICPLCGLQWTERM
jgi:hypothetical protein